MTAIAYPGDTLLSREPAEPPTRPALRWHGGKWRMAPWIIVHLPPHRVYVEPFGGAASVLLRKPRSYAEVYNDLDSDVVNFFQVLRRPGGALRLRELLDLTPFAREEFQGAYIDSAEPLEKARRLIIRSYMGFGSNAHASTARGHRSTGFRANSNRSGSTPAQDWANYPEVMMAIAARLRGVVIEQRPAIDVMLAHDSPETVHYVDPPYLHSLRAPSNKYDLRYRMYRYEMSDAEHVALLAMLRNLAGRVVLSGYASPLYDEALADWGRVTLDTFADGARARTEVLWLNPACAAALDAHHAPLFARAAE